MAGRTLKITILGEDKSTKAFASVEKSAGGFASKLTGAFGNVTSIAGGFVAGNVISKIPGLLSSAGQEAVSLSQNAQKAQTIFGDSLSGVQDWASTNAHAMGLTNANAVTLAANMSDLLKPMGFTSDQAAGMSEKMIGLSGALSEWSGGTVSAADVADRLSKAMLGETDGLKGLGISISADEVNKRAAENATKGLTFETEAQAKAFATQQLVMEKSTDAQKAYADNAGSTARKQAEATAAMAEAKEQLSTALLPLIQRGTLLFASLATILAEKVMPFLVNLGQTIATNVAPYLDQLLGFAQRIIDAFNTGGLGAALGTFFGGIGQALSDFLPVLAGKLLEWGTALVAWVGPQIPPLLLELGKLYLQLETWILTDALPKIAAKLLEWGTQFVGLGWAADSALIG